MKEAGGPLSELLTSRPMTTSVWGLERIQAILEDLERPDRDLDVIHIAGTNGKGSTSAITESVVRSGGRRTGLFTSPHLIDVRERFQVDGAWALEEDLQAAAERVLGCPSCEDATYFEANTALALELFAAAGVEVAILETGLGGRLDATNAVTPVVTLITSIGLDHTDLLGATLPEIAAEKAGIFKSGVPACVAAIEDNDARAVVERTAEDVGAPLTWVGEDATVTEATVTSHGTRFIYSSRARPTGLALAAPLPGRHQANNAALAVLALERAGFGFDDDTLRSGLRATRLPGRMEIDRDPDGGWWVCDIAHNPEAINVLCNSLREVGAPHPIITVVGMLNDKDWRAALNRLMLDSEALVITLPEAPEGRGWDVESVTQHVTGQRYTACVARPRIRDAVAFGRHMAGKGTLLVTGSVYTVGEARRVLGAEAPGTRRPMHMRPRALDSGGYLTAFSE